MNVSLELFILLQFKLLRGGNLVPTNKLICAWTVSWYVECSQE